MLSTSYRSKFCLGLELIKKIRLYIFHFEYVKEVWISGVLGVKSLPLLTIPFNKLPCVNKSLKKMNIFQNTIEESGCFWNQNKLCYENYDFIFISLLHFSCCQKTMPYPTLSIITTINKMPKQPNQYFDWCFNRDHSYIT